MDENEYGIRLRSAGTRTLFELAECIEGRGAPFRVSAEQLVDVRRAMTRISRVLHDLQVEPVPVAAVRDPRTRKAPAREQRFQIR